MNDVLKTISGRYSCRAYDGVMPDDETLMKIAKAAVSAPSGRNRQPWRIIISKDTALMQEIDDEGMAILKAGSDQGVYERMLGRGGKLLYNAPCMMVVVIEPDERHASLMDCGIVAQNIALAATSLGVDNVICGMAGMPLAGPRGEEFKKRLRFPEGFVFGVAVLLGYGTAKAEPHIPDLEKIINVS